MARCVTFSNLSFLHVDLDNAKATDEVGVDAFYADTLNCLVAYNRLIVEVTDIGDITLCIYQVDIRIAIDHDEALSLFAPADMRDIDIAHTIDFIVGNDALVYHVILIERARGPHEEIVACCLYLLWFSIRQVVAPSAYLRHAYCIVYQA